MPATSKMITQPSPAPDSMCRINKSALGIGERNGTGALLHTGRQKPNILNAPGCPILLHLVDSMNTFFYRTTYIALTVHTITVPLECEEGLVQRPKIFVVCQNISGRRLPRGS